MKVSHSTSTFLKRIAFASLALAIPILSGCESVSDGGGPGYYSGPSVTPVEGASMMQDRLGQITRSQIR